MRARRCQLVARLLGSAVVIGLLASPGAAEPVSAVQATGDSSNRLDIAFLGDGYTAGEMAEYAADIQRFLNQLFAEEPFSAYQAYFNIHRVEVISQQSGADKAPEGVLRNTALGAFYYCGNIERLICVDNAAVNGVLTRSLNINQRDLVVILVNDSRYGGSGGQWAISSLHAQSAEIARHEIGHTLGLLADEYVDENLTCTNSVEPIEVNVTTRTDRALIKWSAWISDSTAVPTHDTRPGVPGLYEGGKYCSTGMYRPTHDSKMRSLGRPFEQINSEQLTKRIYNFVSPIDAVSPDGGLAGIARGAAAVFSVVTPQPGFHALRIVWQVDGVLVGSSSQVSIDTSGLSVGPHAVRVTVSDPTSMVRNDPGGILADSHDWILNVEPATSQPDADEDRKADLTVYRPSTGTWFNLLSSTDNSGGRALNWGAATDIPAPGDYDGDGREDIAVYRPGDGTWWLLFSASGYTTWQAVSWGVSTDVPMPADYDGDGRTDIAIYRPEDGRWWILFSSSGYTTWRGVDLGTSLDIPLTGDFDSDGKADLVAYRPTDGQWRIAFSATDYAAGETVGWGQNADVPVPGDYDGDSRTDLAIYRPSDGHWWILFSASGYTTWLSVAWGLETDVPMPDDYDGDGKTDLAIYRPSDGHWWILFSASGYTTWQEVPWGVSGDRPVRR